MNFSSEDFPALGEKVVKKSKPVPQEVIDKVEAFVNSREVVVSTKRCLLCQKDVGKEHFIGEARF